MIASPSSVAPRPPIRGGDPTLASSSSPSDEEFLQVLGEMQRICGAQEREDGEGSEEMGMGKAGANGGDPASSFDTASMLMATSPLEPLFGDSTEDATNVRASDQDDFFGSLQRPLSPPSSPPSPPNKETAELDAVNDVNKSAKLQSAIQIALSGHMDGDPLTPPPSSASASSCTPASSDGRPGSTSPPRTTAKMSSSSSSSQSLAFAMTMQSAPTRAASSRPGGSRSRHGSGASCVSFDSAIGDIYSELTPPRLPSFDVDHELSDNGEQPRKRAKLVAVQDNFASQQVSGGRQRAEDESADVKGVREKISSGETSQVNLRLPSASSNVAFGFGPAFLAPPPPQSLCMTPGCTCPASRARWQGTGSHLRQYAQSTAVLFRQEVELVCVDLHKRFQAAARAHPRQAARAWAGAGGPGAEDPLFITVQLLSNALSRLNSFLMGLDPTRWLPPADRRRLYAAHACTLAILRAAASSADFSALPAAYPLPYGETLGDVEALQLVLAHDLYNELKGLVAQLQSAPGLQELPVALLVMMTAFFTPVPGLQQPDRVIRVHDYFAQKLQVSGEGKTRKEAVDSLVHRN